MPTVTNTDAGTEGRTLDLLESNQTISGLKTFDRGTSTPFGVVAGAAKVDNLDADKLDGQTGADYHDASLLTGAYAALNGSAITNLSAANVSAGTLAVARGGTGGTATPTAGGINYGDGSAHAFTAAGTAGQIVLSGGAGAPTFKNDPLILLKANSGSTTNAAAENVDTYAMASALTAKDTLIVEYTLEAVTQDTASIIFQNSTDGVTIVDAFDTGVGAFVAGRELIGTLRIRQLQSGATGVMAFTRYGVDNNVGSGTQNKPAFVTNWTGAWTLALRHTGVTAGGTLRWSWAIFVLKGQ